MAQFVGVAEAKRRFSELLDRVSTGERIVIARRGKPAVALVPPDDDLVQVPRAAPTGFAAIAGGARRVRSARRRRARHLLRARQGEGSTRADPR